MHEMWTTATDNPVVWASVSLSVLHVTILTHLPDGAILMQPLLHNYSYLSVFTF